MFLATSSGAGITLSADPADTKPIFDLKFNARDDNTLDVAKSEFGWTDKLGDATPDIEARTDETGRITRHTRLP